MSKISMFKNLNAVIDRFCAYSTVDDTMTSRVDRRLDRLGSITDVLSYLKEVKGAIEKYGVSKATMTILNHGRRVDDLLKMKRTIDVASLEGLESEEQEEVNETYSFATDETSSAKHEEFWNCMCKLKQEFLAWARMASNHAALMASVTQSRLYQEDISFPDEEILLIDAPIKVFDPETANKYLQTFYAAKERIEANDATMATVDMIFPDCADGDKIMKPDQKVFATDAGWTIASIKEFLNRVKVLAESNTYRNTVNTACQDFIDTFNDCVAKKNKEFEEEATPEDMHDIQVRLENKFCIAKAVHKMHKTIIKMAICLAAVLGRQPQDVGD